MGRDEVVTVHLPWAISIAGGAKAFAAANGMSAAYVSDVRLGRREPGPKVLDALGLERVVIYRRKP